MLEGAVGNQSGQGVRCLRPAAGQGQLGWSLSEEDANTCQEQSSWDRSIRALGKMDTFCFSCFQEELQPLQLERWVKSLSFPLELCLVQRCPFPHPFTSDGELEW